MKISNENTERAGWRVGRFLSVALPLTLIGIAAMDYVSALMNPVVMRSTEGQGQVEQVVAKLSDPSLLDRLVASLPALTILLGAGLALVYLSWSANQRAKKIQGFETTETKKNLFGFAGFLVVFLSIGMAEIGERYFDAQLVFNAEMVILAIGAIALVVLDSVDAKGYWNKEHKRAEVLDRKMQDVV